MVAEDPPLLLHVPQGTVDLARVHPVEAQLAERLLQLVAVGVSIAQDEEEKRHEPVGRRLLQHFVSHPLAPSLNLKLIAGILTLRPRGAYGRSHPEQVRSVPKACVRLRGSYRTFHGSNTRDQLSPRRRARVADRALPASHPRKVRKAPRR